MYPNLYYAFRDFFGVEWNGLKIVNTFGFVVALSFLAAAWILTKELKRKQQQGLFQHTDETITIGAPASFSELFVNFILGFIFGYKIIGAFTIDDALNDPQSFILSARGNAWLGLATGALFCGLKWWEKRKQRLEKPETRTVRIWPHDRVGDIVIYAAIFGFLGAKIFHNLENWNEFVKDPWGSLVSFSGLTFYGGLICAGAAIIYYSRKKNISVIHLCDATAPAMMLAYAVGRLGCHLSGDGDWGEPNISRKPFAWLPDWMWSYKYPHNVLQEGTPIRDCAGQYCNQLPVGVYPTSLYEFLMCLVLFFVLWSVRKRIKLAGQLSGLYLIFNGMERFFIEQIRINTKYEFLPFKPTQAEIISLLLVIAGVVLIVKSKKWFNGETANINRAL
ncbi:prolipoprotein diacylglyceryl transferase [Sediminibacterium soli]|uniref:prolipoprotein diacylglyceryl transferase n=1 Tax=Sediminibacterium soli TaxID=2698829 RepID=UPI00137B6D32|nr:prolipoprotein diacylglyceryl transferase family protein [Sediminibacterium soli]NCI46379.1 prolipoprotein diacylglyceryl transferase [Sediminibacterium soli]